MKRWHSPSKTTLPTGSHYYIRTWPTTHILKPKRNSFEKVKRRKQFLLQMRWTTVRLTLIQRLGEKMHRARSVLCRLVRAAFHI